MLFSTVQIYGISYIHFVSIGLDNTTATLVFEAISDCIPNVYNFLSTCRIQFDYVDSLVPSHSIMCII